MIDREDVAVAGVLGPLSLEDALFMGKKANRLASLQVVRADRVLGIDHVHSAAVHAQRAIDEGRQQADRPEVEFVRYLAGRRQIKNALDHVGLQVTNAAAVVVAMGPKRQDAIAYFVHGLGLEEDDGVLAWTQEKQDAWGFPPEAMSTTTRPEDLVLEAVAAVDLMRS